MARRKNIKWTKELDTQLISLRRLGVKPREVAKIMKLPVSVIYSRSVTLGVTRTSAQLEMDLPVAPATKTEFRESPKKQIKPSNPKPWWKRLFGGSDMGAQ